MAGKKPVSKARKATPAHGARKAGAAGKKPASKQAAP